MSSAVCGALNTQMETWSPWPSEMYGLVRRYMGKETLQLLKPQEKHNLKEGWSLVKTGQENFHSVREHETINYFSLVQSQWCMGQVINSQLVSLIWEAGGERNSRGSWPQENFFYLLCSDRYYVILGFVFSSQLTRSLKVFIGIIRFFSSNLRN